MTLVRSMPSAPMVSVNSPPIGLAAVPNSLPPEIMLIAIAASAIQPTGTGIASAQQIAKPEHSRLQPPAQCSASANVPTP
jgi:hypothetical protein